MTEREAMKLFDEWLDIDKDEGPAFARVLFRLFLWILYALFVYGVFVGY